MVSMKKLLWVVVIVAIALGVYFILPKIFNKNDVIKGGNGGVACTMEAKLCPDGSYVGRSGPKCEFAKCPDVSVIPTSWKTYTNTASGFSFSYPPVIQATYIIAQDWPPTVRISGEKFSCIESQSLEKGMPIKETKVTVSGRDYCIETQSEGAAGSTYINYTYTTTKGGKLVSYVFVLKYPNCDNYPDPKKTECKNERNIFNLNNLIEQITQTLKL